jgi:CDP-glycerol glycerophosphotransferase
MPLLSLVLVVHREQAYLEELAGSVLVQAADDVELLAIDDASPDQGPAMLDALAARDPRVRVRHLPDRVGLAAARDAGLELAEGEHVWFVEATDLLAPGAVAEVAERLRTAAPDVLIVHHQQAGPLGGRRAGPHRALLARVAGRGPGTLDERPGLADAAPELWNKVFRRDHLRDLGVPLGSGDPGGLAVSWAALLAAGRIDALPVPAYVRRRPGNALRDALTAGSPADVFAAHDAVAAFLDAHPGIPAARRRLVAPAMLRHQLRLLERVPEEQRREFFARIAEDRRRHGAGDADLPPGRLGRLRARLVDRDRFTAFRVVEAALGARRALGRRRAALARRRGRLAARVRRAALQRHYRSRLRRPIDPDLAVFAAYWYRGYSCNPRAIYEKARELVPGFRGVWVVKPEGVADLPEGVEYVVSGTREYYDAIARANWFVNNVNFPNHLVKRPGTTHVMTHHGTPLKRMGLDLQDTPVAGNRMDFGALLRRCERWDYSVSANPFSTPIWERVYPTRYESLETGYPRNDALANATAEDVRRIRAQLGIEPDQVAVLYAPTHREYRAGHVPVLDLAAVAEALGPGHLLLARLHYFYGEDPALRRLHREGRIRDVSAHPSIEELCLAADVLLTDFSSIMFDYAVLDRPIVIHAPDWEVYRAMRGTYFDLMAEPPGVVTRTEDELVGAFRTRAVWGDDAQRLRAAFRARFASLEDGGAAERVVRRVWLGEPVAAPRQLAAGAR